MEKYIKRYLQFLKNERQIANIGVIKYYEFF